MRDDIDEQLPPVFIDEAQQLVLEIGSICATGRRTPRTPRSRSRCAARFTR
jgi:hypothetical protein